MTLKSDWLELCESLSIAPGFFCGARKIITNKRGEFGSLDDSLTLADAGYTKSKLTMLTRHYLHNESRNVALHLWDKRKAQGKYGSVGFTTYAHFVKGGGIDAKRSKIASVFGPCIQSVVITLRNKREYSVDVFYRTTEFYKKFPADLVLLRDVLLRGFDFDNLDFVGLSCHFANITAHPMYAIVMLSHIKHPIAMLLEIKKSDPMMWRWIVKWSARYLCREHVAGILKFSQAMRVKAFADKIEPQRRKQLTAYMRKNLPKGKLDGDADSDE